MLYCNLWILYIFGIGKMVYSISYLVNVSAEKENVLFNIQFTSESSDLELILNDTRVIGGITAKLVVPYQVSLQLSRKGQRQHFCSGSIITSTHVLTAAHCVDKMKLADLYVRSGSLNWKMGGDLHRVTGIHIHTDYRSKPQLLNDIAVLKVMPAFNFTKSNIAIIDYINDTLSISDRVFVRLTGWGSTTAIFTGSTPEQLQILNYYTISNEECILRGFNVSSKHLCALSMQGYGACNGDSGGPLVISSYGAPRLVGIVSFGTRVCAQGKPDVYTRVSSFLPYINKVITNKIP